MNTTQSCFCLGHPGTKINKKRLFQKLVCSWYGSCLSGWHYHYYCGMFINKVNIAHTGQIVKMLYLTSHNESMCNLWQEYYYHADTDVLMASKLVRILMFARIFSMIRLLRVPKLLRFCFELESVSFSFTHGHVYAGNYQWQYCFVFFPPCQSPWPTGGKIRKQIKKKDIICYET